MRIYLAAKYSQMKEMQEVAKKLILAGHEITSQWVWGKEGTVEQPEAAHMDVDDVLRAECVLLFTQPYGTSNKGGGRHFEFGLGYGSGKICCFIGEKETIFQHLSDALQYKSLDEFIDTFALV